MQSQHVLYNTESLFFVYLMRSHYVTVCGTRLVTQRGVIVVSIFCNIDYVVI